RLLRSELMRSGHSHIKLAGDTAEALDLLANDWFRTVLCDTETGPLKGAEFVFAARTHPGLIDPYNAIIAMSFGASFRKIAACRDAGANASLAKPVSNAQLTEKLRVSNNEHRRFVRVSTYFGPERRKGARMPFIGSERRVLRLVENQIIRSSREAA